MTSPTQAEGGGELPKGNITPLAYLVKWVGRIQKSQKMGDIVYGRPPTRFPYLLGKILHPDLDAINAKIRFRLPAIHYYAELSSLQLNVHFFILGSNYYSSTRDPPGCQNP